MKKHIYAVLVIAVACGAYAPAARAGFDFVPPAAVPAETNAPAGPATDAVMPLPADTMAADEGTPLPATPEAPMPVAETPTPAPVPVSAAPIPEKAPQPVPAPAARDEGVYPPAYVPPAAPIIAAPVVPPAPVAVPPSAPQSTALAAISGFGDQIPLSFAMDQIVPSDFTVQYVDQPDPDTIVSWAGGRAWNKVLEDMLYAHGYRVRVTDNVVYIFKAGRNMNEIMANPAPGLQAVPVPKAPVMAAAPPKAPEKEPILIRREKPPVMSSSASLKDDGMTVSPSKMYDAQKIQVFSARTNENLGDVLARWCKMAHVQLDYGALQDYTLPRPVSYNATFSRAIERVLDLYAAQAGRPVAELNTKGAVPTLVVRPARDDSLIVQ